MQSGDYTQKHRTDSITTHTSFRPKRCCALIPCCGVEAASMRKRKANLNYRRIVLRLPDLDHSKMAVLNSLTSPGSRRVYQFAINQFITWYCSEPRLAFNRIVVVRYRMYLESRRLAANTINQQLAA